MNPLYTIYFAKTVFHGKSQRTVFRILTDHTWYRERLAQNITQNRILLKILENPGSPKFFHMQDNCDLCFSFQVMWFRYNIIGNPIDCTQLHCSLN